MSTDDPIILALVQNQLDHISRQVGWVMTRTARSPIFSESHDFSCFLTTKDGDLVSVADGLPIHTGGGSFAVRAVLRDFKDDLRDGDTFLLNDPYEAGGNHLPDWTIVRPVFSGEELVAFSCNRAHQSDIGGGAAGTYNPEATEIFHEGIRLPVLRLVEGGRIRDDLWRLLLLNTRCPELLDGDLRAMVGSTRIGAEKILDIVGALGIERTLRCFSGILDHAERLMRAAILDVPDGIYRGTDMSDTDCLGPATVNVRVSVRVHEDTLEVDFSGSDPQTRGFKNSSLANTYSSVFMAILTVFDESIPRNQGAFRPIKIVAPEGTVVNAKPPAAMTMNTVHPASDIIHAIWQALADALPERACAPWGKTSHCTSSVTSADGQTDVLYHWLGFPAGGAVNGRDGFNTAGQLCTLGGIRIPNVEFFEKRYPVRVHRHEFREDAAGPGEFRGGTGMHYVAEIGEDAEYSFRGEGIQTRSGLGVSGGSDGEKGAMRLTPLGGGSGIEVPQYGLRRLPPVRLEIDSTAGGGWGNPYRRDVARVHRDVLDGIVSIDAARTCYGVVIDRDTMAVDERATFERRANVASQSAGAGAPRELTRD